jgi:hypothetical protein
MRKIVTLGSVVAVMGALSWADTTPPAPAPMAPKGPVQPCKEIEQACTGAGFVKGEAAEGKGLFKNCMDPILKGQAVNGVTVDPTVVAACKQRMVHRHGHRQGGGNAPGGQGSNPEPETKGDSGDSSNQ